MAVAGLLAAFYGQSSPPEIERVAVEPTSTELLEFRQPGLRRIHERRLISVEPGRTAS